MDINSVQDDFDTLYPTEEACAAALFAAKWPNGFVCARCDHDRAYIIDTRKSLLYECSACHYQSSLRVGTIMEGSRTPLHKWFRAFYVVASISGINAVQLQEDIQVTYKTAWLMLAKIRHAISDVDDKIQLSGFVRVSFVNYSKPYTQPFIDHPRDYPVLIASAPSSNGNSEQIKIKPVSKQHIRNRSVLPTGTVTFANHHIDKQNAEVSCITKRFYKYRYHDLIRMAKYAFKWINDTFRGIGPKYMKTYLDEFCYRWNHKFSHKVAMDNLVTLSATNSAIRYSTIIRKKLYPDTVAA